MIKAVTFMNKEELVKINSNFMREDLKYVMDKLDMNESIVDISDITIAKDDRNQGNGSQELQNFCAVNMNSVIITNAICSKAEYPEEPSDEKILEVIDQVSGFFEKNGFKSVNNIIGQYEFGNVMVYENDPGKKIIKHCEEAHKKFKLDQAALLGEYKDK